MLKCQARSAFREQSSNRDPMKLCDFLFDLLYRHGVRRIFGIPGDFVLNVYQALEQYGKFQLSPSAMSPQ